MFVIGKSTPRRRCIFYAIYNKKFRHIISFRTIKSMSLKYFKRMKRLVAFSEKKICESLTVISNEKWAFESFFSKLNNLIF